jgi:nucleolar protein 56
MKAYIVHSLIGIFAFNEKGKVLDQVIYSKISEKKPQSILEQDITKQEEQLIERLKKKGFTHFISSKKNKIYKFEPDNLGEKLFRKNFRLIVKNLKIKEDELNQLLTESGIEFSRQRIKETVKKDKIVMQVIDAIDEIDKSVNIFIARLREWYGLHFPEGEMKIEDHEKFAKLVSVYGLRDNIKEKDLVGLARTSMGINLTKKDEEILKEYATNVKDLYKLRSHLEKYIDHILKEVAPNLRELGGPLISARLISMSGGLEKLAKKPSSTIQLLGAEKALFRFLKGRGKSPKYGLLFTHPLVQNAAPEKKGKVARVLASKLSIAVKMDYYGNRDKSKELKEDLEKRIEKIKAE